MVHKIVDGVPRPANLRRDFPNTSFPEDLSIAALPEGYVWIRPTTPPVCGLFERVELTPPVLVDGVWTQQWVLVPWDQEKTQNHLVNTIQNHLDDTARIRAYDGILSLCTYAASPNPKFAIEGQAGVEWRDACWTRWYEILAEYQEGLRSIPTPEELIAELPEMVWPVI